jgi:hypothetical protein
MYAFPAPLILHSRKSEITIDYLNCQEKIGCSPHREYRFNALIKGVAPIDPFLIHHPDEFIHKIPCKVLMKILPLQLQDLASETGTGRKTVLGRMIIAI